MITKYISQKVIFFRIIQNKYKITFCPKDEGPDGPQQ